VKPCSGGSGSAESTRLVLCSIRDCVDHGLRLLQQVENLAVSNGSARSTVGHSLLGQAYMYRSGGVSRSQQIVSQGLRRGVLESRTAVLDSVASAG
jgi:hypothetical protein